jgi:hypothetical protein
MSPRLGSRSSDGTFVHHAVADVERLSIDALGM